MKYPTTNPDKLARWYLRHAHSIKALRADLDENQFLWEAWDLLEMMPEYGQAGSLKEMLSNLRRTLEELEYSASTLYQFRSLIQLSDEVMHLLFRRNLNLVRQIRDYQREWFRLKVLINQAHKDHAQPNPSFTTQQTVLTF